MTKVLATNDDYVTLGVVDKNMQPHMELRSVTFADHNGTAHTVHTHKDGPFSTVEEVLSGWEDGILHAFDSHDKASAYERERGNTAQADALAKLAGNDKPAPTQQKGSGY